MAPNPLEDRQTVKRSSHDAGFDTTAPNKKQRYHHQHFLHWKQDASVSAAFDLDSECISQQLVRSIGLVCEAVGFEASDAGTLESFRALAEECKEQSPFSIAQVMLRLHLSDMLRFLDRVRQSMLAARRIQPVPEDFLTALHSHHLTLRSLLVHLKPPVTPGKSVRAWEAQIDEPIDDPKRAEIITTLLNQASLQPIPRYIPSNFPPLPSQHTYKAEAVYNRREQDPKKVRERATEEGRLGEDALRRLVSASLSGKPSPDVGTFNSVRKGNPRKMSRALWKATMEAVAGDTGLSGGQDGAEPMDLGLSPGTRNVSSDRLGPAVNAERMYWRKSVVGASDETTLNGS